MTLASGTRLGSYEITAAIGTGGMGKVYRARDATLSRNVAIKILPGPRLTQRRSARFESRERRLQRTHRLRRLRRGPRIGGL